MDLNYKMESLFTPTFHIDLTQDHKDNNLNIHKFVLVFR
jgi:hypothetical protein